MRARDPRLTQRQDHLRAMGSTRVQPSMLKMRAEGAASRRCEATRRQRVASHMNAQTLCKYIGDGCVRTESCSAKRARTGAQEGEGVGAGGMGGGRVQANCIPIASRLSRIKGAMRDGIVGGCEAHLQEALTGHACAIVAAAFNRPIHCAQCRQVSIHARLGWRRALRPRAHGAEPKRSAKRVVHVPARCGQALGRRWGRRALSIACFASSETKVAAVALYTRVATRASAYSESGVVHTHTHGQVWHANISMARRAVSPSLPFCRSCVRTRMREARVARTLLER